MAETLVKGDFAALDKIIESTMKKYDLRSDPNDVKEMIIDELRKQALEMRKGSKVVPVGVSEEELVHAIIKCSSHVKAWKQEKKKKSEKTTLIKEEIKPLEKSTKKVVRKKKEKEEEFEELSLF